jgi:hypothetical protein
MHYWLFKSLDTNPGHDGGLDRFSFFLWKVVEVFSNRFVGIEEFCGVKWLETTPTMFILSL